MDAHQFQHQVLCYSDQIYRMALSILKDENKAKDLFQELMMHLWERREQLEKIENRRAYLLTSTRNMCIDLLRREPAIGEIPVETMDIQPNPHQLAEQSDTLNFLHHLIDELPEMQRIIIRMRDVEEMEIAEIAEILSITENAVTVNLSRARKKLREKIVANQQKERKKYDEHDR